MTNTAISETILPTPHRLQHANDNYVLDPTTRATRMADSPLDRLARSGGISNVQHAAGHAYFSDYYHAGLAPLGAVDYGKVLVDGSKPSSTSDRRLGARDRYNKAADALGGYFRPTVDAVCLHEQGLEVAGRKLNFNNVSQARAAALVVLRGGLDVLARVYRLG